MKGTSHSNYISTVKICENTPIFDMLHVSLIAIDCSTDGSRTEKLLELRDAIRADGKLSVPLVSYMIQGAALHNYKSDGDVAAIERLDKWNKSRE